MAVVVGFFALMVAGLFYAKTVYGIVPLGGPITFVTFCPDQQTFAVTIGPPLGGVFNYAEETIPYPFYQLYRVGPWTVGSYIPGSLGCTVTTAAGTYPLAFPMGSLSDIGTSL